MPDTVTFLAPAQSHPARVTRWRSMKFGLMMHWGLYSVAGGVWNGKQIEGYNEQIKHRAKIAWPDYLTLLPGFTAAGWNPDAIAQMAADAGMRYIAITTKHHDGFNLWHTHLSDFNALESTPAKRDLLRGLADACTDRGMQLGFYYSLIDWHYPGAAPMSDHNSDPITPALEEYTIGQLRELLTGYGPLCEIWFDMSKPTPDQSREIAETVRAIQPDCLISGRIWNDCDDFMECSDNETPEFWFDGAWESSVTMYHETWGYRSWQQRDDLEGKTREKIRDLAFVTSRGGNYLLNIGPRGDGSIVEFEAEVLRGVGRWVKAHAEAIYDSLPQPHLKLDFGYATARGNRLYLYIATPAADGILRIPGWSAPPPQVRVLGNPDAAPLHSSLGDNGLEVTLPSDRLDPYLTILSVDYIGEQPYIPAHTLTLTRPAAALLPPANSLTWHRMTGQDYYSLRRYVAGREWLVRAESIGNWKLFARRPAGAPPVGYQLFINGCRQQFILPETDKAKNHECAQIILEPGKVTSLLLKDITPTGELREEGLSLELVPA